jgi:hypothetical protein
MAAEAMLRRKEAGWCRAAAILTARAQPLAAPSGVDLAPNNVYFARRNLVFGLIFVRSRLWAALQEIPPKLG